MQSMTGYGRGLICEDGREMTVEVKSVNHRFSGCVLSPGEADCFFG